MQKSIASAWFLDSCASRYSCNNRSLFKNTHAKSIDFVTAVGQIIRTNEIGTVAILLTGGTTIELHNVAFAPQCDSNLISLGQQRKSGITYHDDPTMMILIKDGKAIVHAKRERNLFILDLAAPGKVMAVMPKAMAITRQGRPTHLVSHNKHIRIWHRRLAHASNARVIRAYKLTDGIDLKNIPSKEYDPAKVLIDSDDSDASDADASRVRTTSAASPAISPTLAALPFPVHPAITPLTAVAASTQANNLDNLDKLYMPCVGSKSTRIVRQNKSMTVTTSKLEEVHADLWGPHDPLSRSGSTYAAILMCEHTKKTWTLYLRGKDEFIDAFQAWLPKAEAKSNCSMKALRADGGREFISIKLQSFCETRGIAIKYAAPYIHKENGLAERGWRTIVTMKDSMLIDSGLPNDFWAEAIETANYLCNRLPTRSKTHGEMILEESWTGKRQNLSHIRIFGSLVLANIPEEKRSKSNYQKTWQRILIGYSPDTTKHFRVWAPQTKQVIIASEPFIDEFEQGAKLLDRWPIKTLSTKRKAPAGEPKPRGRPRKYPAEPTVVDPPPQTAPIESTSATKDSLVSCLPIRNLEQAMSITESNSKIHKPGLYDKAVNDPIHGRRWQEAIKDELQNLENHHTWEYEELPLGRKAIGSKWVFKVQYHPDRSVARFKARLVAQGFSQVPGIDFSETFAPTVRRELLQIYLALCLALNLLIH